MVLVYLPTKLGDFGQGQMLGFIFQHHGAYGLANCFQNAVGMAYRRVLMTFFSLSPPSCSC